MFSKSTLAAMTGAAVLSLAAFGAQADTVNFEGQVVDTPCNVTSSSIDQSVQFGKLPQASLEAGTPIAPVAFKLDLANCTVNALTNKTVAVTFNGSTVAGAPTELDTQGGTGVAITIASSSGTGDVTFGTADAAIPLVNGSNALAYSAVVKKATGGTVVPGDFTAVTNFTLAYQ